MLTQAPSIETFLASENTANGCDPSSQPVRVDGNANIMIGSGPAGGILANTRQQAGLGMCQLTGCNDQRFHTTVASLKNAQWT